MSKQKRKYHLSIAGEFFVAAQLRRQGIMAAVTYGNAKRADVLVYCSTERALVIEVKSTSASQWLIGENLPEPSEQIWVLVYIPANPKESPEFFILTQTELHGLIKPEYDEYRRKYKAKHGKEFIKGREKVRRKQVEIYKDCWEKIKAKN